MKDLFPGYFRRSEQEWQSLWDSSKIVLDTNFLLDLYRYSEGTRKEILDLLSSIQEKLFIPHQVAYEFLENRLEVIAEQGKSYEKAISDLQKINNDFNNNKRHPFIKTSLLQELNIHIQNLVENLGHGKTLFDSLLAEDPILDEISNLFEGKVGHQLSRESFDQLCIDGEERYRQAIPPGFKDSSKPTPDKFGDLIIWNQILSFAKENPCNILFITSDSKEDWWWIFNGKTIGPRHELVKEIKAEANVDFHIYLPESFIRYSGQYLQNLQNSVEQNVIDEIKEINKQSKEILAASGSFSDSENDFDEDIFDNVPLFTVNNFSEFDSIEPSLMSSSVEDARRLMIRAIKVLIRQGKKNIVPKAGLKNMMTRLDPTFDESNYGFDSFTLFLGNFPNDVITLDNYSGGHIALATKILFNE